MTLHRAANNAVDRIDLTVLHCDHGITAETAYDHLAHFFAKPQRPALQQLLDQPSGNAEGAQYTVATKLIGDVTVALTWSRDVYAEHEEPPVAHDTESLRASISITQGSDKEQLEVSKDPHVIGPPRCAR